MQSHETANEGGRLVNAHNTPPPGCITAFTLFFVFTVALILLQGHWMFAAAWLAYVSYRFAKAAALVRAESIRNKHHGTG